MINRTETRSLKIISDQFGNKIIFRATLSAGRLLFEIKKEHYNEVLMNLAKFHFPKRWQLSTIKNEIKRAEAILKVERIST